MWFLPIYSPGPSSQTCITMPSVPAGGPWIPNNSDRPGLHICLPDLWSFSKQIFVEGSQLLQFMKLCYVITSAAGQPSSTPAKLSCSHARLESALKILKVIMIRPEKHFGCFDHLQSRNSLDPNRQDPKLSFVGLPRFLLGFYDNCPTIKRPRMHPQISGWKQ